MIRTVPKANPKKLKSDNRNWCSFNYHLLHCFKSARSLVPPCFQTQYSWHSLRLYLTLSSMFSKVEKYFLTYTTLHFNIYIHAYAHTHTRSLQWVFLVYVRKILPWKYYFWKALLVMSASSLRFFYGCRFNIYTRCSPGINYFNSSVIILHLQRNCLLWCFLKMFLKSNYFVTAHYFWLAFLEEKNTLSFLLVQPLCCRPFHSHRLKSS